MSESFDWSYPGLNWSEFHSLANLLSLRNGGQAEPSSLSDTVLEEDWDADEDEDEDVRSVDTRLAHQISGSGHGKLKRRFLDCLAEFAANKKGGMAVACSAMKEAEDNVVVWIARNEGFSDADERILDKLGKLLGSLSGDRGDDSETLLWEHMVSYHQKRIDHSCIPDLRRSFKAYDAERTNNNTHKREYESVPDDYLSAFRTLLFECNAGGSSVLEKHIQLVITSCNLRRTKDLEEILYCSPSATSRSKSLWLNICLLARIRVAFYTFKDIALTLPSFEQVTIALVPRPLTSLNPSQRLLTLRQTFGILKLDLSLATTKAVLGQNWTVAKVEREFGKRQKQKLNIHAEVQMLMFLNTNVSSASGLFPYFGCSKLSCFMCNRFIQSYGRFKTRGCHGRLFKPWTVPAVDWLLPGHADRTARALISVQKEVEKQLKASVEGHIRHERTSVVGGSSIVGGQQEQRSQRQLQIERLRMKAERERVAEMFRSQRDHTVSSITHNSFNPGKDEPDWDCDICMRLTKRRCSICNQGHFCSDACQDKRSGIHLFTCSKRPLTSADYLWRSLAEDLMPQDEDVLQDFGFNNALAGNDKTYLLGLYQGLYLSGKFSAEDLHEWRMKGVLVKKMKEFYYDIPEHCRGQYFPWFLKNQHVLGRPLSKEEAQQKLIATFYDKARPYLDAEDRDKLPNDLKPEAKGDSYALLAEILSRFNPHPVEKNYYSFGFVTCRGHGEECILVDLYQLLVTESDGSFFYEFHNSRRDVVEPATFTQFWKAYEDGTLIQLIDAKGLKGLRSRLPFLEGFLSPPARFRPSVWDLKQFLEINDPVDHPPIRAVNFDYGFMNCRTFEETCTLMEIYGKVFERGNPLELHQACVTGNLFEFASNYVQMKEQWRSLMKNFYPLDEVVQLEPEPRSRGGSKADADSAGSLSLLSRLWRYISGSAN